MWLLHSHRPIGCVAVLEHEEVAEKRLRTVKVCLFSIGRPKIKSTAHRLFGSIIEIVAKGWSDL